MPIVFAGATLDRAPGPKYLEILRFAEVRMPPPVPRVSKLAKWRTGALSDVTYSLVAPAGIVTGGDSEELDWLRGAIDALAPKFVVAETGTELTPGQRDRERLRDFVEGFARHDGGARLVWSAGGMWDPDDAREFASELGIVLAFDPLEDPPGGGSVAYARLRALGARQRFGEGVLYDAAESLSSIDADEVYVCIESPRSFREATTLAGLVAGLPMDV